MGDLDPIGTINQTRNTLLGFSNLNVTMALTFEQSKLVRGSIPMLKEQGERITGLFYSTMITAHPELRNMFNLVNQANRRQPRALCSVILAFASNLSHTHELIPKLERVCHKHCSLGIRPEHYDIVGKYLLQAFAEVLGSGWTPQLHGAWSKAYSILARMLIGREVSLYKDFGEWQGWRSFRIHQKIAETEDIYSFYLVPSDGASLPSFIPGQYISVRIMIPGKGHLQPRQYALSETPRPDYYRISVKRDRGVQVGKGVDAFQLRPGMVSNQLIDDYAAGDTVEVTHPAGDFNFDTQVYSTMPVVLISAGSGVSPLTSILNTIVENQPDRPISWIHCSARRAPFEDHVRSIARGRPNFAMRFFRSKVAEVDYRSGTARGEGLRMDLERIDREQLHLDHGAAEYYISGPEAFSFDMSKFLRGQGVDPQRIRNEWFTTGEVA